MTYICIADGYTTRWEPRNEGDCSPIEVESDTNAIGFYADSYEIVKNCALYSRIEISGYVFSSCTECKTGYSLNSFSPTIPGNCYGVTYDAKTCVSDTPSSDVCEPLLANYFSDGVFVGALDNMNNCLRGGQYFFGGVEFWSCDECASGYAYIEDKVYSEAMCGPDEYTIKQHSCSKVCNSSSDCELSIEMGPYDHSVFYQAYDCNENTNAHSKNFYGVCVNNISAEVCDIGYYGPHYSCTKCPSSVDGETLGKSDGTPTYHGGYGAESVDMCYLPDGAVDKDITGTYTISGGDCYYQDG